MGGEAGVVSTLGVGSTFWITACLKKKERRKAIRPAASDALAEQMIREHHHGCRILLVDDEPINLEIARFLLEETGLAVDTAEDGVQAVRMVKENAYALILIALLESLKAPAVMLHVLGASLLAGRILHAYALSQTPHIMNLRVAGMMLTFLVLAAAAVGCITLGLPRPM